MAENQDERSSEDLSDEASPYKIEEFRKRGIVAQSRELTGVLALLATVFVTYAMAPQMGAQLIEFMREVFRTDLSSRVDLGSAQVLRTYLLKALMVGVSIGGPIALAGFLMGILASFIQIGSLFSTEPLAPDVTRVDPIAGFRRLFSMRQLIEGARMLGKAAIIVAIAYSFVKEEIFKSMAVLDKDAGAVLQQLGKSSIVIFSALAVTLVVFAGLDYAMQRFEFGKKVRLTKAEAKQEAREREGDPQIKARIRAVQREMARKRMMAAVKKADVIITNPTHIAIAIAYDKDKMAAPRVIAKGADFIAQQIKKLAAENNVPMVENVPLARALFKAVKLNHSIPRSLYQAVAEVLAYVYRLKGQR